MPDMHHTSFHKLFDLDPADPGVTRVHRTRAMICVLCAGEHSNDLWARMAQDGAATRGVI